jgi:hypothetical protein
MGDQVNKISDYMIDFGLSLIGHAIQHAIYLPQGNPYSHAFGVLHAAQAGEIIIKSCIAKIDPLLIFKKIPKLNSNEVLNVGHLLKSGKTLLYSELPDTLFQRTGYNIGEINLYRSFGELRNTIQHFAVPDIDLDKQTLQYACQVIDPMTQHFWGVGVFEEMMIDEDFIDYISEGGLQDALDRHGIAYKGNTTLHK